MGRLAMMPPHLATRALEFRILGLGLRLAVLLPIYVGVVLSITSSIFKRPRSVILDLLPYMAVQAIHTELDEQSRRYKAINPFQVSQQQQRTFAENHVHLHLHADKLPLSAAANPQAHFR